MTQKHSVLVVDDEKQNRVLLSELLKDDYKVFLAKNGIQALERAREHLPDLIMLDVLMPEMDGYQVIRALKADDLTRDIPVIFISALDSAGDEEKGLELGALDYIPKPFHPSIVRARVRNHMSLSTALSQLKKDLRDVFTLFTEPSLLRPPSGMRVTIGDTRNSFNISAVTPETTGHWKRSARNRSNCPRSRRYDATVCGERPSARSFVSKSSIALRGVSGVSGIGVCSLLCASFLHLGFRKRDFREVSLLLRPDEHHAEHALVLGHRDFALRLAVRLLEKRVGLEECSDGRRGEFAERLVRAEVGGDVLEAPSVHRDRALVLAVFLQVLKKRGDCFLKRDFLCFLCRHDNGLLFFV